MGCRWVFRCLVVLLLMAAGLAWAGTAAFDLPGPRIHVRVTRAGKSLPISQVPNLQAGDRIWVHPDLPEKQSVHYLLVAAFLRGATNPPPENWFIKAETWSKRVRDEGIVLTVPHEAQQVLLFLAPETGGDFGTLRSTVRGKPGAFVRAAQDLNQAGLERSRLDVYLEAVRKTSDTNPAALHDRSVLLARSLNIKLDQACFDRPTEQQLPCLTQNADQLVLEDVHSQSMVTTLTSGPGSDLIGQLSTTKVAGGGAYSPYVGVVVDLARLLDNFHTPEYQYIPALAVPKNDELNLKLNNPPSFKKPMSVLVIGLPAVEDAPRPPMRAVSSKDAYCLQKPSLLLPVEGAPLAFATNLAHDFVLKVKSTAGQEISLPAAADSSRGGFAIDARGLQAAKLDAETTGTLRGYWGFQAFDGPSFHLRSARSAQWTIPAEERTALVIGRDDTLHLQSAEAACVEQVTAKNSNGKEIPTTWKLRKSDELEVQVGLKDESAGGLSLLVKQYGLSQPDSIAMQTYAEAGRLDGFQINAGDREGILKGTRLDQVAGLELKGVRFVPADLSRAQEKDELRLQTADNAAIPLQAGEKLVARVGLKDGRSLELPSTVEPPRPKVSLVSKSVDAGPSAAAIRLGSQEEIPHDGKLSFVLRSEIPENFPRDEKIEVAAENESFSVLLGLDKGNLILQDAQTVLAELDPAKNFGPSAFGRLRFRPVQADGTKGDWQPLGTLVRVPSLAQIHCSESEEKQCTLSGTNLFLIDSIASDAEFTDSVSVPLGFANSSINVPRPTGGTLYVKLRDDPSVVSVAALPTISRMTAPPTQ